METDEEISLLIAIRVLESVGGYPDAVKNLAILRQKIADGKNQVVD